MNRFKLRSGVGAIVILFGLMVLGLFGAVSSRRDSPSAAALATAVSPVPPPVHAPATIHMSASVPLASTALQTRPTSLPIAKALPVASPTPFAPQGTFVEQMRAWQTAAVKKYPDLGKLDSALNQVYRREYQRLKLADSGWFSAPNWPMWLADECDKRIKNPKLPPIETRAAKETYPAQPTVAAADEAYVAAPTSYPTASPTYTASAYSSGYVPSSTGGPVYVHGYTRKDGTYVRPHTRKR